MLAPGISIAQSGVLEMSYYQAIRFGATDFPSGMTLSVLRKAQGAPDYVEMFNDVILSNNWGAVQSLMVCVNATRRHRWGSGEVISVGNVVAGDSLLFHWTTDTGVYGDAEGEGGVITPFPIGLPPLWDTYYGIVSGIFTPLCEPPYNLADSEQLEFFLRVADGPYFEVVAVQDTIPVSRNGEIAGTELQVFAADREDSGFDPDFTVDLSLSDTTLGYFAMTTYNPETMSEETTALGPSLDGVPYDALDPDFRLSADSTRFVFFLSKEAAAAAKTGRSVLPIDENGYASADVNVEQSDDPDRTGTTRLHIDMLQFAVLVSQDNTLVLPDTVAVADTALVQVLASNRNDNPFDGDYQVQLAGVPNVPDPAPKGTFVLQSRNTTTDPWSDLASDTELIVNYPSLDAGYEQYLRGITPSLPFTRVLYIPDPVPEGVRYERVQIRSFRVGRITQVGFDDVVADRHLLKLSMPPSPETGSYWPSIEEKKGHTKSTFEFDQVVNNVEGIVVKYLNNGIADETQNISVSEDWVIGSGGHDHGANGMNTPPLGANARRGFIITGSVPPMLNKGKITATTDVTGKLSLDYKTPEMGGKVLIKAETTVSGDTLQRKSPEVEVRVPGLVLLPVNTQLYTMVGGTCNHHGPSDNEGVDQNCKVENNNHWLNPEFLFRLTSLAIGWQAYIDRDSTLNSNQRILRINDLSLPFGGLFDISGKWVPSHHTHRVGRDADIRTKRTEAEINSLGGVLFYLQYDEDGPMVRNIGTASVPNMIEDWRNTSFERLGAYRNISMQIDFPNDPNGREHYHLYYYP